MLVTISAGWRALLAGVLRLSLMSDMHMELGVLYDPSTLAPRIQKRQQANGRLGKSRGSFTGGMQMAPFINRLKRDNRRF